jgi:hypothetical protein
MDNNYARYLVGRVKVSISSLVFQNEVEARQSNSKIVKKLLNVFTTTSGGCERDNQENHIPAIITPAELDHILSLSQLTRDDLQVSLISGMYPKLSTSHRKIYCLDGRHRVKALLQNSLIDDYWIIALYCFDAGGKHMFSDYLQC